MELRSLLGSMRREELAVAGHAVALSQWHAVRAHIPANTQVVLSTILRQSSGGSGDSSSSPPRSSQALQFLLLYSEGENFRNLHWPRASWQLVSPVRWIHFYLYRRICGGHSYCQTRMPAHHLAGLWTPTISSRLVACRAAHSAAGVGPPTSRSKPAQSWVAQPMRSTNFIPAQIPW
jgi:hypothetical protein